MIEAGYQTKTVQYARSKGFLAHRNYFAPGAEVGWPDVEIFMPGSRVLLIEFKMEGEEPRKLQEHRLQQLMDMGHITAVCTSYEQAKKLIDDLAKR